MSVAEQAQQATPEAAAKPKTSSSGFTRIARYTAVRLVTLFITIVIGIYLTILIANMGGYVDNIQRGDIRETIGMRVAADPTSRSMTPEERTKRINDLVALEEKRLGLNRPFMVRSLNYLSNALTLDLGRALKMSSDSGSREVRLILLERLPPTLVLFATANLILFFVEIFLALFLSRRYGTFLDKVFVTMAPTSSAPAWFYGIFLILIFAALLKILPFGGMVDAPPPEDTLGYALSLAKHMLLPMLALACNSIFVNTYAWRTFFLIYSSEDYVDMAKAKGLGPREIERRYVLRPTLPTILTSFALVLIYMWQGAIILETVFQWPGLGRQIFRAVGQYDTPVIVGSTVIFAYLLAITVFLLDFVYALVDPRVKIGGGGSRA